MVYSQIIQNVSRNIFIMVPENLILFLPNFVTRIPFLNYDLSKINIVNYASCSCGAPREDVYHYFFTFGIRFVLSDCSFRMAFLNLVNVSRIQSDWSSRFQSLTVDGITDSVVIESLQKFESTNPWVGWFNIRRKY
jgi:hypothetical protein